MDKDGPKTHSGHPWIETHSGRSHQDRSSFTPSFSRWAFLIHSERDARSIFDDFNFGIFFFNFSSLEESSSYSSSAQERNLTGFLYLAQAIRIEKRRPVDAAAGRRSPATTANNGASSNPATAIGIFGRIADEIVPAQFILQCSGIWRDVKTLRNTIHESRCEWLTLRFYHCHTTHTHTYPMISLITLLFVLLLPVEKITNVYQILIRNRTGQYLVLFHQCIVYLLLF